MKLHWAHVCVEAISYLLPDELVTSVALEEKLGPLYAEMRLRPGQIESLTGIRERRFWPPLTRMSACAAEAGRRALAASGVSPADLGAVVYAGVCRDDLEPATACAVAAALGVPEGAVIYDLANACLGVLNAMTDLANRIELKQIRAGVVVAAESSREIIEQTIAVLLGPGGTQRYRASLATLTGGSGAVAVVLTHTSISDTGHRLRGGAVLNASRYHGLCRWGPESGLLGESKNVMETDGPAVLANGVELAKRVWSAGLEALGWRPADVDTLVCHQVAEPNQRALLAAIQFPAKRELSSYAMLGNIGSVSLPLTLAIEQGALQHGARIALFGIGSGLNSMMLGVEW